MKYMVSLSGTIGYHLLFLRTVRQIYQNVVKTTSNQSLLVYYCMKSLCRECFHLVSCWFRDSDYFSLTCFVRREVSSLISSIRFLYYLIQAVLKSDKLSDFATPFPIRNNRYRRFPLKCNQLVFTLFAYFVYFCFF